MVEEEAGLVAAIMVGGVVGTIEMQEIEYHMTVIAMA